MVRFLVSQDSRFNSHARNALSRPVSITGASGASKRMNGQQPESHVASRLTGDRMHTRPQTGFNTAV